MKPGAVARYRYRYRYRFLLLTGVLTGLALSGLLVGLLLNQQFVERYFWLSQLTMGLWVLLACQSVLAAVVMIRRLLVRRWACALGWLLLVGLGLGVCGATMLPVMVLLGAGTSIGEPPLGSPGRIEADRADRLYESGRLP